MGYTEMMNDIWDDDMGVHTMLCYFIQFLSVSKGVAKYFASVRSTRTSKFTIKYVKIIHVHVLPIAHQCYIISNIMNLFLPILQQI